MTKNARDAEAMLIVDGVSRRRRVSDEQLGNAASVVPARVFVVERGGRDRSTSPLTTAFGEGDGALLNPPLNQKRSTAAVAEAAGPQRKRSKTTARGGAVDPLKEEVVDLLETKIMGSNDDKDKLEGLRILNGFFREAGSPDEPNEARKRWVIEWQGGFAVLVLLRQQLDKCEGGRPARDTKELVRNVLLFLCRWNCYSKACREVMSKFGGIPAVVRAMDAYPDAPNVQHVAINSLLHFSGSTNRFTWPASCDVARLKEDANNADIASARNRRRELVEAGVILRTVRVLTTTSTNTSELLVRNALDLLGVLCDDATPDVVKDLNQMGAVVTFASLWNHYHQNQTQQLQHPQHQHQPPHKHAAAVMAACRSWIHKLTS